MIVNKHIVCIQAVVEVALDYGAFLGGSWSEILSIISKLDYLQYIASGARRDSMLFSSASSSASNDDEGMINIKKDPQIQQRASMIMENLDMVSIDKIFTNSTTFDDDGIVNFITALVKLSQEELKL